MEHLLCRLFIRSCVSMGVLHLSAPFHLVCLVRVSFISFGIFSLFVVFVCGLTALRVNGALTGSSLATLRLVGIYIYPVIFFWFRGLVFSFFFCKFAFEPVLFFSLLVSILFNLYLLPSLLLFSFSFSSFVVPVCGFRILVWC